MKKINYFSLLLTIFMFINYLVYAQEITLLEDNLQGSTEAGTQYGGSFTSDGYKPGVNPSTGRSDNHIMYKLSQAPDIGYIEFEVKGFDYSDFPPVNESDPNLSNAFVILYDGRGITEPIRYFYDYRNNYFRWEIVYRSEHLTYPANGDRFKAKMLIASPTLSNNLPNGQAAKFSDAQLSDPAVIWKGEPDGITTSWNPNTWYKIRVYWNNVDRIYQIFRDTGPGTSLVEVWNMNKSKGSAYTPEHDFPLPAAFPRKPLDFRFNLGAGPSSHTEYQNFMPDIVYRNLKVVSTSEIQNSAPNIFSNAKTTAQVGSIYSYDVNATGYPEPSYSLVTYPSGMTINSTSGLIQWTPTNSGNFNISVKASNGISPDAIQNFTISVQAIQNQAPVITSNALMVGFINQEYIYDVNASGSPTPTYSLITNPSGMTINSVTGLIQWMPFNLGSYDVSVKASNGISPDAIQSYEINVTESSFCSEGIISYWRLDETSGTTYFDEIGLNPATSNDLPTPTEGKVNGGQMFNGTSNKITIEANAIYDWTANSSFALEAWFNHSAVSFTKNENIIGRKDNSNFVSIKVGVSPEISFGLRSKTGESFTVYGPNVYDGQWHHVVGIKDGPLNQLRLYVDGILVDQVETLFTSGFDSPTAPFTIGWKDLTGDESYFEGIIDEVAIYNDVIHDSVIFQHYNNGLINRGYCEYESPNDYLRVFPDSIVVESSSGISEIIVESNVNWIIDANSDWISIEDFEGSGNDTISVSYLQNNSNLLRTGIITISNDSMNTISTIYQMGSNNYITIPKKSWDVSQYSGDVSFYVESNLSWTINSKANWLIPSILDTSGTASFIVHYEANLDTSSRIGVILIENEQIKDSVSVIQDGANPVEITVSIIPSEAGIIEGAGIYGEGSDVNLVAMPNSGWKFDNWTENNETIGSDSVLILSKNKTSRALIANFSTLTNINEDYSVPENFTLSQNYPNPFNPSTTISFGLPQVADVSLTIYNLLGQEIMEIFNKEFSAGSHQFSFDASQLTSGIYIYTLVAHGIDGENFSSSKKMIILK